MTYIYNDKKYKEIVEDILYDNRFDKIKDSVHHGVSRYDHSLRVSFIAYKIAKTLRLDYESTARGGLLHDYFTTSNDTSLKEKIVSMLTHPKRSLANAKKDFGVTEKEANIIEAHMFFVNPRVLPKYMESWVVILADTVVGGIEFGKKFQKQALNYATLAFVFLRNYI